MSKARRQGMPQYAELARILDACEARTQGKRQYADLARIFVSCEAQL